MKDVTASSDLLHSTADVSSQLFDGWFDPIEAGIRQRVRSFIETMIEEELDAALSRPRYGRRAKENSNGEAAAGAVGHRHGHRTRTLTGTFGKTEIEVPRARLAGADGKTAEWKSKALRAYQRRTVTADALIAGSYLAGTNTRRVRRALASLFGGAVGKDVVSRTWRKVKSDWDAWNARSLAGEPIVRLILDGTVVRVRLDRKATSILLLVVIGVRADCGDRSFSSSTALLVSTRQLLPCGAECRCSAVPCTSIATCWPTRHSACTRRSRRTTTT
jgi:putative transposase